MAMTAMIKGADLTDGGAYDVERIRADFPILARQVHGKPLVYLDNGASAQKPRAVLEAIDHAYRNEYANVHRGLHFLSNAATAKYEEARETVRRFLNAASTDEIIFTRNATEAINLVASSYGGMAIGEGDEIILSIMEHHSNIVPWHFHRERRGAVLKWAPVTDEGEFPLDKFEALFSKRTKMVAITHMSNVLGTVTPLKEIVRIAHAHGVPVLADGAQAAVHMPLDVQDLDIDFYAFTGHKTYGPSGIGVLYAKRKHLDAMPPYMGGGEMIESVHTDRIVYGKPPHKFEAGTPPIVQAIGLGAALDYMMQVGRDRIAAHEAEPQGLRARAARAAQLAQDPRDTPRTRAPSSPSASRGCIPTTSRPSSTAPAWRCVLAITARMPLMERLGVTATCRASFAMYNTKAEVDALAEALVKARAFFK